MRKLPESQTQAFDIEYIKGKRWLWIKELIDRDFQKRPFRVLDVGGGNGALADKILFTFPNAEVTILDYSEDLLRKNVKHPRKQLIFDSAENLGKVFRGQKFDLITLNLVLHHLVGSTYQESKNNAIKTLELSNDLLPEDGRLFICEHFYSGLVFDSLASRMIYGLTSVTWPLFIRLFRRMGANTAGTGVCFQSCKAWKRELQNTGFHVITYDEDAPRQVSIVRHIALHIRSHTLGFFWLCKKKEKPQSDLKAA